MITKATLYLDSDMYQAFKLRSVEIKKSVSSLLNDAMREQLSEDLEDISLIRSRIAKNEKPLSYEKALEELKSDGLI